MRDRRGRRLRVAWLLKDRLDAELDELALRLRRWFARGADDLDGPLEVPRRLEVRDEIRHADRRRAFAVDDDVGTGLLHLREPQRRRQRAADLIQHVDRTGLSLAELLDEDDALLQLRLTLLELLHLLNDRMEPCRLLLRRRDLLVELAGVA